MNVGTTRRMFYPFDLFYYKPTVQSPSFVFPASFSEIEMYKISRRGL